jgi:hypothetical protein
MTLEEWLTNEVATLIAGGDVIDCDGDDVNCHFAGRTLVPERGAEAMASYLARRLVAAGHRRQGARRGHREMTAHICTGYTYGYDWGVYQRGDRAVMEANDGEYDQEILFCPYCGAKISKADRIVDELAQARAQPDEGEMTAKFSKLNQARLDAHVIKMLRQVADAIDAGRDGEPASFINTGRVNLLNYAADRLEELTRPTQRRDETEAFDGGRLG